MVCPPKMRGDVFTPAAVDNIDHNPSSTTSKEESFRGTGISLFQTLPLPVKELTAALWLLEVLRPKDSGPFAKLLCRCSTTKALVPSSTVTSLTREYTD